MFLRSYTKLINSDTVNLIKRTFSHKDTIFNISSGFGKCGVAVIRVSGPETLTAVNKLTNFQCTPEPRYAFLKKIHHPISKDFIDKGLILWFPGPNSFTGEDSCEFQIHGGLAVINSMFNALNSIDGLRFAEAGEFTKRAFYSGKLDLTEVEGLADLIHAETEAQRKQALYQANGSLSQLYQKWRTTLLKNIAHLEAYIDFSEDQNIEDGVLEEVNGKLLILENDIKSHLNDGRRGERLREGVKTVILGEPNVGKSSFLNLICQKSVSIVTNIEGTTRDVIESNFNIGGYPIILADTAGLRKDTGDIVEIEGISRAKQYADVSDFIILLIDALKFMEFSRNSGKCDIKNYLKAYLENLGLNKDLLDSKRLLIVLNKIDLISENEIKLLNNTEVSLISCTEQKGITNLLSEITSNLKILCGEPSSNSPTISQERHRHLLCDCLSFLRTYREQFDIKDSNQDLAIAAQLLRSSMRCLGKITGEASTEEILDVIFKDFCIGK